MYDLYDRVSKPGQTVELYFWLFDIYCEQGVDCSVLAGVDINNDKYQAGEPSHDLMSDIGHLNIVCGIIQLGLSDFHCAPHHFKLNNIIIYWLWTVWYELSLSRDLGMYALDNWSQNILIIGFLCSLECL